MTRPRVPGGNWPASSVPAGWPVTAGPRPRDLKGSRRPANDKGSLGRGTGGLAVFGFAGARFAELVSWAFLAL